MFCTGRLPLSTTRACSHHSNNPLSTVNFEDIMDGTAEPMRSLHLKMTDQLSFSRGIVLVEDVHAEIIYVCCITASFVNNMVACCLN